jgi:hypothetical protein
MFLILSIIELYMATNVCMYVGLHVKYLLFLSDFNEPWTFWTEFRKNSSNVKFHKAQSSPYPDIPLPEDPF